MYAAPFKFPGSKRRAMHIIGGHFTALASEGGALVVPFMGAGWEPMTLLCDEALAARTHLVIGDASPFISRYWQAVAKQPDKLLTVFDQIAGEWCALPPEGRDARYYALRDETAASLEDDCHVTAAYLLVLQRLAFNGLFRTNASGRLNVPKGTPCEPTAPVVNFGNVRANVRHTAALLARAASVEILHGGWQDTVEFADFHHDGGYILCDPPYMGTHSNYTKVPFSDEDQRHIAEYLGGTAPEWRVSVTNSAEAEPLYGADKWNVVRYDVRRSIAPTNKGRGAAGEIIAIKK